LHTLNAVFAQSTGGNECSKSPPASSVCSIRTFPLRHHAAFTMLAATHTGMTTEEFTRPWTGQVRESHGGRLDKGLDEARARGWTVVSVKDDSSAVFRQ
jgi:hypothetical protein